jgi:hypothetical protein
MNNNLFELTDQELDSCTLTKERLVGCMKKSHKILDYEKCGSIETITILVRHGKEDSGSVIMWPYKG